MRVAALYDIHGNLPALQAVLSEVENAGRVDEIIVGGDVLWGPMESECLDLLLEVGAVFVAGNCERDVLHPSSEIDRWCRARLSERHRALIETWPLWLEREIDGLGAVLFCHATPTDNEAILTRITPDDDVAAAFAGTGAAIVICGHTHFRFDRDVPSGPRLVNVGSVGLPYEGAVGAFWAFVGPEIDFRQTTYDVERAIVELRATTFPRFDEIVAPSLQGRVTAVEATTEFESRRGA
ncbi:MAG: metallophosphatase family protein [Thermoleophilia bacterium]|nr:metallophosphatase family protein [Thermoleophilia bacterium]